MILHAFRHFLAGGFGIRQVLDILLFEQKYMDEINHEYVVNSLKEVRADKFLGDLIFIGNKYLGFKLPEISLPNCPDELLEDLFYGDIFGNATHKEKIALELTKAAVANAYIQRNLKEFAVCGIVKKVVFPSKRQIINSYPELEHNLWKLPIYWIYRCLKYFKYRELSSETSVFEIIKISKRRIKLLKKYGVL